MRELSEKNTLCIGLNKEISASESSTIWNVFCKTDNKLEKQILNLKLRLSKQLKVYIANNFCYCFDFPIIKHSSYYHISQFHYTIPLLH